MIKILCVFPSKDYHSSPGFLGALRYWHFHSFRRRPALFPPIGQTVRKTLSRLNKRFLLITIQIALNITLNRSMDSIDDLAAFRPAVHRAKYLF